MSAPDLLRDQLGRLVDVPPTAPDRLASVRRRASRIRRNRVAAAVTSAVAAVVVIVVVGTTVVGSNRSAPVDPLAPPATTLPSGVLLVDRHGAVSRLAAMTDHVLEPVRDLRLTPGQGPVAVAGGRVLAATARGWELVDPARPGSARVLLRPDHLVPQIDEHGKPTGVNLAFYAIRGVGPRLVTRLIVERGGERVWLVTARTQAAVTMSSGPFDLYAMDLTGHVDPAPIHLAGNVQPVAAGRTGMYAIASSGTGSNARADFVQVDRSGHLTTVRRNVIGDPFTAGYGEMIVAHCCDGADPMLFDADTGRSVPVTRAGRLMPDLVDPQFSVDGRYIVDGAEPPVLPLEMTGNNVDSGWAYVMIDSTTGRATVVPGTARYGDRRMGTTGMAVWSGDRLVWTEELAHRTLIGAYLPANGRSVITSVPTRGLSLLGAS